MTDQANTSLVSDTTYGPADEMLSMVASTFTETRAYNADLQLVDLSSGVNVHYHYNYAATQNNGQIQSKNDLVSGETTVYQYDTLRRLINASATGDPSGVWSQAFQYDGFGNLTQKQPNNAPALSIAVNPANNRIQTGAGYDANGNMTAYAGDNYAYDIENRMVQATPASGGTVAYGYDSVNHRIYQAALSGTTYSAEMIYFYGADGRKYGDWKINPTGGVLLQASVTKQWFGGRLLTPKDHVGSRGKYFPYGEERTNVTPANPLNDQEKFATYTRDSATGLDYANQRYYGSNLNRFLRPDPIGTAQFPGSPQSWNMYAYVMNDPINGFDPAGTCTESASWGTNGYDVTVSGCASSFGANYSYAPGPNNTVVTVGAGGGGGVAYSSAANLASWQNAVYHGLLSDCQAFVGFLSNAQTQTRTIGDLINSVSVFVDSANRYVNWAGLPSAPAGTPNNHWTFLDSRGVENSGFKSQFIDGKGPKEDQAHHFATFLELGYKWGTAVGYAAAGMIETGPEGNANDIALANRAVEIGNQAASVERYTANSQDWGTGTRFFNDLPSLVSGSICNPDWKSVQQPN